MTRSHDCYIHNDIVIITIKRGYHMSATQLSNRTLLGVGEFSPLPSPLELPRTAHWLDIARPIHRFFAHPLTIAIGWGIVFLLSALVAYGWLMVVSL